MHNRDEEVRRSEQTENSLLIENRFLGTRCLTQHAGRESWRGLDLSTGKPVLMKLTALEYLREASLPRLERQASVLQELRNPWLSAALSCGRHGDSFFQVMPHVTGVTLAERLTQGRLTLEETLPVVRCLLAALEAAHERSVLHLGLKPSNIILAPEGPLRGATLIHFGPAISDLREGALQDIPASAVRYLAPEQTGLLEEEVGPATDLYSVGAVLFECLTGRPRLQGTQLGELLRQHLCPCPELSALGLQVPRALDDMLQHLLRMAPQTRYQSAAAVLENLDALTLALEQGVREPALIIGLHDHRQLLSEPAFIERGAEMPALEEVLERTLQGQGGLLLIEGESGSGKTMLLDELARRSLPRGVRIFRGQATHQAERRSVQLCTGVIEGVGAAAQAVPALKERLRARLGAHRELLCEAWPDLMEVLGCSASHVPFPEELAAGQTVKALTALFDALGREGEPVLVLLDDCQWADEQALQLLADWQRARERSAPGGRYTSVVVAFRREEVGEGHPLRRLAAPAHITLSSFEPSKLHRLAISMAGQLPQAALDTVARLSEGNPFMATAVVRGLVESGALIPRPSGWRVEPQRLAEVSSSRQAAAFLLQRLESLPETLRRLLVAGAILGREFELDLAALLAGLSPGLAAGAMREARQRHLLWEGKDSRYTFAHDRLREALLEQLSEQEVRALHTLAAQELERRDPSLIFELAHHFDAGGQPTRALPYALRAAEQARQRHVLDLAECQYRVAERGAAGADLATSQSISEGLGDILTLRSAYQAADPCFQRALALAENPVDQARLECKRGELAHKLWDTQSAIRSFERALRLLGQPVPLHPFSRLLFALWETLVQVWHTCWPWRRPREVPVKTAPVLLAVNLYHGLSWSYFLQGNVPLGAVWASLRELNLAERHPASSELARACAGHSPMLHVMLPFVVARAAPFIVEHTMERGRRYFHQAMDLFGKLEEPLSRARAIFEHALALLYSCQYNDCIPRSREAAEELSRLGDCGNTLLMWWSQGLALYHMGELAEAEKLGQRLLSMGKELDQPVPISLGLHVLALATEGNLPRETIAAELARSHSPSSHLTLLHFAEGMRLLRAGQTDLAVAAYERAEQFWKESRATRQEALFWRITTLRKEALRLPPCASSRRAELLRQAHRALRRAFRSRGAFSVNRPYTLRERGWIAALESRDALARRCFDRSLVLAERLGMKYERARTLLDRAEVGSALGWPDAAADRVAGEEALRPMRAPLGLERAPEPLVTLSLVDNFPRLLEAGRSITSALTREAVFATLREAVLELLRAERVEILEVPEEGLACREESSWVVARHALEQGRPVVLPVEQLESQTGEKAGSTLGAPILLREQVVACLCATHPRLTGLFGQQELRIAEFMAALAGAALERAQSFAEVQAALRKRDEFLAVASHELRTPLTPLKLQLQGLLHSLRQSAPEAAPERWAARLEAANARVQRFARLVEDLFDFSRLNEGRLPLRREPVNLSALAEDALERWREEWMRAGCDCTLRTPGPVVGHWDGLRLEQVIDNLLSNAIKYGPGQPILIEVEQQGEQARLQVHDFGMGIALKDQARIFERFERAVSEDNYGGFGLGLWLCREVTRGLGGAISVRSTPGKGATFTIELPLS